MEAALTVAVVVGACAGVLWLMLRRGSVAHRARDGEDVGPTDEG